MQGKSQRTSRQRFARRKSAARQPAVDVVEDVAPRLRRGPLMHVAEFWELQPVPKRVGSQMRRRSLVLGRQSR